MNFSDRSEDLMTASFGSARQKTRRSGRRQSVTSFLTAVRLVEGGAWARPKPIVRDFCRRQRGRATMRAIALLLGDLSAMGLAIVLALLLSAHSPNDILHAASAHSTQHELGWHGWGSALITLVLCTHLSGRGHYRLRVTFWAQALDIISACLLAFLCDVLLSLLVYREPANLMLILHWFLAAILLLAGRSTIRSMLDWFGLWRMSTVIIGEAAPAERARAALTADRSMGYEIVATLEPQAVASCRDTEACYRLVTERGADLLAVAGSPTAWQTQTVFMAVLGLTRIPVTFIPACTSLAVVGCDTQHVHRHDVMLLTTQPRWTEPLAQAVKAVIDYCAAAILCLASAPLLAVIALCVRLDGGPALFGQSRVGAGGRAFTCLKFRSMRVDAAERLAELLENDPISAKEWATQRKLSRDPRITRVGRFLRNTSLDELPQLLNVLRGEMSLVGPRPIVAAEVEFYGDFFRFYIHMKPGLTGLWQASGRSDTSYAERVRLDVWYARNWTLWQDCIIVMMTIPAVLFRRGAV